MQAYNWLPKSEILRDKKKIVNITVYTWEYPLKKYNNLTITLHFDHEDVFLHFWANNINFIFIIAFFIGNISEVFSTLQWKYVMKTNKILIIWI